MKTIQRANKVPKHIASCYGGARKFRQFMRRRIEGACREMNSLSNLGAFTPADADDIHDVLVLLDRIKRDLSQKNWGK